MFVEAAMSVDRNKLAVARDWLRSDRDIAIAILAEAEGSSPFEPGAMMLADAEGNVEGSVTGGCVEAALAEEASEVLGGAPARVRVYGISDELAGEVGLMCGGTVHVLVSRLDAATAAPLEVALAAAADGAPAGLATLVDGVAAGGRLALVGSETIGTLGGGELLDHNVGREMAGMLERGVTSLRRYGEDGATMGSELRVLIQSFAPAPLMVIFGAIDFAAALAPLARHVGYDVEVVDPRAPFLDSPRFTAAARTVVAWPDAYLEGRKLSDRDAVLVFTHDPKLDEPALIAAVRSGAGYVGALGSRRTQRERARRLREAGLNEEEIATIAAPCGLDIGARTPAETAVSILAEVVAQQNARSGEPLTGGEGSIHADV
jgi:xanthine dehydrogenase accessory factor